MGSVAPTGSRVKMRRNIKDIRSKPYGIGDLSGRTGVNIETIRYYERIGIMPEPPRSAGRQRVYDPGPIKRVASLRRSREPDSIGRPSCRERVCTDVLLSVVALSLKQ